MITFFVSLLGAVAVAFVVSAIAAVLMIILAVILSSKLESPTDWFFSIVWKIGWGGAVLAIWLCGYFFKALS